MMETKVYQAATMAQALADVKRSLGRDAVIVNTRRCRRGGLLGLFGGRAVWEVHAAAHHAVATEGIYVPAPPVETETETETATEWTEPQPVDPVEPTEPTKLADEGKAAAEGAAATEGGNPRSTDMNEQMDELRRMVETLVARGADESLPPALVDIRRRLADQEVDAEVAESLMSELRRSVENQPLPDSSVLRGRLSDLVARRIRTLPPSGANGAGGPCVIALIGPTGVGKTTTIAKMAANLKLREGKRVGLITIDTYRIAAVDQLRTYAEIIDVPLQAVLTPTELRSAIREMSAMDVVLIDTAGRSQNDQPRLKELRRFLHAAECDEVHLVVSASSSGKVARAACRRFAPVGAHRIIMTKLDEAATFGMILNITAATGAAVSFVTTGQDVPDDIRSADANLLAQCIVQGSWHES